MSDIENNPTLPWDRKKLLKNPNVTLDYIEKNLDQYKFEWYDILKNLNITLDFLEKHYIKCYTDYYIHIKHDISLEYAIRYSNIYDWNWKKLIHKYNSDIDLILKNKDILLKKVLRYNFRIYR